MANEVVYDATSTGTAITDLRIGEALSAEFLLLLADRNSLPQHGALVYAGNAGGSGSATIRLSHIGLQGYNLLASTADGVAVSNTVITDGSTDVTVSRYAKSYEASDLARLTGSNGLISPDAFAADAMASYSATLTSLVANLVDNFSSTVGTSTSNFTVTNWLDAITTLEVAKVDSASGYMAILHPVQYGDLRSALATSSTGALQWSDSTQEQMVIKGGGYKGQFMGVDVFVSSHVPTANSGQDRAGGMFGRGAIVWADATVPAVADTTSLNIGGKVLFEQDRTAKSGLTAYVSSAFLGASEGIDACGVSIITDA